MSELCWISLQVPDVGRAARFWRDVLGLEQVKDTPAWVELRLRPGLHLSLHPVFHPAALQRRGYDRGGPVLGLRVQDLDALRTLVERHGARALGSVQDLPTGKSQDFVDPDGYVFELVQES